MALLLTTSNIKLVDVLEDATPLQAEFLKQIALERLIGIMGENKNGG
jgi:hypothetical protein